MQNITGLVLYRLEKALSGKPYTGKGKRIVKNGKYVYIYDKKSTKKAKEKEDKGEKEKETLAPAEKSNKYSEKTMKAVEALKKAGFSAEDIADVVKELSESKKEAPKKQITPTKKAKEVKVEAPKPTKKAKAKTVQKTNKKEETKAKKAAPKRQEVPTKKTKTAPIEKVEVPSATPSPEEFSNNVLDIADKVAPWTKRSNDVYISDVWAEYKKTPHGQTITEDEFKDWLLDLHQSHHLELKEAQLKAAMDMKKVRASKAELNPVAPRHLIRRRPQEATDTRSPLEARKEDVLVTATDMAKADMYTTYPISDLKRKLMKTGLTSAEVDDALIALQNDNKISMLQEDDPRALSQEDHDLATNVQGFPKHRFWVTESKPTKEPKAEKKTKVKKESKAKEEA